MMKKRKEEKKEAKMKEKKKGKGRRQQYSDEPITRKSVYEKVTFKPGLHATTGLYDATRSGKVTW